MAAAVTGWYGPLIDLAAAASHVGGFVQLLVLVRRRLYHPIQRFKASKGEAIHRTLIQVGDDTRAYFCLRIANKHQESIIHADDVALLQNVKLVRYGEVIEAVVTQVSSVQVLLHSSQLVAMAGVDELIAPCQVGITTREKLKKVVEWALKTESVLQNVKQNIKQSTKNWKSQEENNSRRCTSVSDVLRLTESCNVNFLACIGEIVLQSQGPNDAVKSKLLLGNRLLWKADRRLVEEIICTGCKQCGSPVDSRYSVEEMKFPLYCQKNTDYIHSVCSIYRPLLLYVKDHSKQVTLLVKNKAAEMLFGNLTAEHVHNCYQAKMLDKFHEQAPEPKGGRPLQSQIPDGEGTTNRSKELEYKKVAKHPDDRKKPDFCSIWLILLKMLLHKENSPFSFEVSVNMEKDPEDGRFELISIAMPCHISDGT